MRYRAPSRAAVALTLALSGVASVLTAFGHPAQMRVDGAKLFSDVPPVTTLSDRVFVPLRSLADALGAQTSIQTHGRWIVVTRNRRSLRLRVGDPHAVLDGMPMTLKHVPFLVRGRVMVSADTMQRAFGVHIRYDALSARVDVHTPGIADAYSGGDTE